MPLPQLGQRRTGRGNHGCCVRTGLRQRVRFDHQLGVGSEQIAQLRHRLTEEGQPLLHERHRGTQQVDLLIGHIAQLPELRGIGENPIGKLVGAE
ncbi:hypothetical protein SDC9_204009 [bioreactor metagenome]|uniref:Uncharacterized protein n=1 Tax=bioreactor metagenome TaxID=1076179 RepID=A0A645IYA9_9ZZZZ